MQIRIDSDIKLFRKQLNNFQKKQLPFAAANAITSTLFQVKTYVINTTWPAAVTVRNKRFLNAALRVRKANKKRLRAGGSLYDRLNRDLLSLQAEGGTKRPVSGRNIAIPVNVKRLKSGKISLKKRPRNIPDSFVTNLRNKGPAVWQRLKTGRTTRKQRKTDVKSMRRTRRPRIKRLRLMYELESSARIDQRFDFYQDAIAVTRRRIVQNLERSMAWALDRAQPQPTKRQRGRFIVTRRAVQQRGAR